MASLSARVRTKEAPSGSVIVMRRIPWSSVGTKLVGVCCKSCQAPTVTATRMRAETMRNRSAVFTSCRYP